MAGARTVIMGSLGNTGLPCELYPNNATLLVDTYNVLKSGVPNAIRAFRPVRPLGPAGAELGHGPALGGPDDAVGLGGDEGLMVQADHGKRLLPYRLTEPHLLL